MDIALRLSTMCWCVAYRCLYLRLFMEDTVWTFIMQGLSVVYSVYGRKVVGQYTVDQKIIPSNTINQ